MKRKLLGVVILCFFVLLGANYIEEKLEEVKQPFDAVTEPFLYEGTENVDAIAVDKEGDLYTISCITKSEREGGEYEHELKTYDLEGNMTREVKVNMGNGNVDFLIAEEEVLYSIVMKQTKEDYAPTLYAIDTKTWKVKELYSFENYKEITNFAHIKDYFYVIGDLKEEQTSLVSEELPNEKCISRVKIGEYEQQEILAIDNCIDIVSTKEDTLLIYYKEENYFGFLELEPKEMSLKELSETENKIQLPYLTECENGFLFCEGDTIFYGETNGTEYVVVNRNVLSAPIYQRGFVFYIVEHGVERMGIADVMEKKVALYLLRNEDEYFSIRDFYKGGYKIRIREFSKEEYKDKLLGQGKIFDMYLLDSSSDISYEIKENGEFYALNEVEGVMEYLDACFPYIKEAATNEDGEIWMIPISFNIPMLLYDKEYCNEQEVDLSNMSFMEFLTLVEQIELGASEQGDISYHILREIFFLQYLSVYDSFDTSIFREYASRIKQLEDVLGEIYFHFDIIMALKNIKLSRHYVYKLTQEEREKIPDFYYLYERRTDKDGLYSYLKALTDSDMLGVIGVPKISKEVRNIGAIKCLAVNPKSKNLKITLEYISDFCNYMMGQKDSFLLADESTYTNLPLIKECYEAYKDGTVIFEIDKSIYWELFDNYMQGEMELEEAIKQMQERKER